MNFFKIEDHSSLVKVVIKNNFLGEEVKPDRGKNFSKQISARFEGALIYLGEQPPGKIISKIDLPLIFFVVAKRLPRWSSG